MTKKKYTYEVALSFAGEQRQYVEQVARRLKELGISHFYDKNMETELWGKNLAQHFQAIYFEQSKYFVPFISDEYKNKIWTRLELSFALDRNMQQQMQDYQNYILPVYFVKTRVPGLVASIGYIDGSKVSPTELADLIYEKVTGRPPVVCTSDVGKALPELATDHFQTPHTTYTNKLCEYYADMNKSCCIVVSGERGVGKRTTVHHFLRSKSNVLHVKPQIITRYALEPIACALGCSDSVLTANDDLWVSDRIMRKLIEYCTASQKPILYFENMEHFSPRLTDFVFDLCKYLFNQSKQYQSNPVCVILEFDNNSGSDIGDSLYQLPAPMVKFLQIPRLSTEKLREFANNMLGTLSGDEWSIDYIFRASCGNLLYLNIVINYLCMKGYLIKQDSEICICKRIPDGALADILRKYIFQRYDRLDRALKEILSKSAVIGQEFDQAILANPFDVQDADKMLRKIEELTRLIKEESLGIYSFETMDSYRLITSTISREELQEWHRILAEYYQRKLDNALATKCEPDKKELISLYIPISKHNKYAAQYRNAVFAYLGLIECRLSIADYNGAIDDIQMAKEICGKCEASDLLLLLDQFEAKSYFAVGNYTKALEIFSRCSISDDDGNNWANNRLDTAYCYYMIGENGIALRNTLDTKQWLEKHNQKICLPYYKTLSFLASIYDALNNDGEKRRCYVQALNFCKKNNYEKEYYEMLKKASMVFDEQLSIPMYQEAARFFKKTQQIKDLAETLHNIATDLVYLNRAVEAYEPLSECIQLFDSFGSVMVHYPLNTKGILEALDESDYCKALLSFQGALAYTTEPFSEITIRTNIAQCQLQIQNYPAAKAEIEKVDTIVAQIGANAIPVYRTYHDLNWGFYFYHTRNYNDAIACFQRCKKNKNIEPRFHYIQRQMLHLSRQRLHIPSIAPIATPPKPVLQKYIERELYFTTVRFFE